MSWYMLPISGKSFEQAEKLRTLQERTLLAVEALGSPDAVIFEHESYVDGSNTGNVEIYFSPAAARLFPELLSELGAVPCDQPHDDGRFRVLVSGPEPSHRLLA